MLNVNPSKTMGHRIHRGRLPIKMYLKFAFRNVSHVSYGMPFVKYPTPYDKQVWEKVQ